MTEATKLFPRYLMKIDGKRKFLSLGEAAVAYDSGLVRVSFGRYVLHEDFTVVPMSEKDKRRISDAADEYSANK